MEEISASGWPDVWKYFQSRYPESSPVSGPIWSDIQSVQTIYLNRAATNTLLIFAPNWGGYQNWARYFYRVVIVFGEYNQAWVTRYQPNLVWVISPPQKFFDPQYYQQCYPDVIQPWEHYCQYGFREGRYPNPALKVETTIEPVVPSQVVPEDYAERYPVVKLFLKECPSWTAQDFFDVYGRRMGHLTSSTGPRFFDVTDYLRRAGPLCYPYYHYITIGRDWGWAPNAFFDERFYCQHHPDIAKALRQGILKSGFDHYRISGWKEDRAIQPNQRRPIIEDFVLPVRVDLTYSVKHSRDAPSRIWFLSHPDTIEPWPSGFIDLFRQTLLAGFNVGVGGALHHWDLEELLGPSLNDFRDVVAWAPRQAWHCGKRDHLVTWDPQMVLAECRLNEAIFWYITKDWRYTKGSIHYRLAQAWQHPKVGLLFSHRQLIGDGRGWLIEDWLAVPRTPRPVAKCHLIVWGDDLLDMIVELLAEHWEVLKDWTITGLSERSTPLPVNITREDIIGKFVLYPVPEDLDTLYKSASLGLVLVDSEKPPRRVDEMVSAGLLVITNKSDLTTDQGVWKTGAYPSKIFAQALKRAPTWEPLDQHRPRCQLESWLKQLAGP